MVVYYSGGGGGEATTTPARVVTPNDGGTSTRPAGWLAVAGVVRVRCGGLLRRQWWCGSVRRPPYPSSLRWNKKGCWVAAGWLAGWWCVFGGGGCCVYGGPCRRGGGDEPTTLVTSSGTSSTRPAGWLAGWLVVRVGCRCGGIVEAAGSSWSTCGGTRKKCSADRGAIAWVSASRYSTATEVTASAGAG